MPAAREALEKKLADVAEANCKLAADQALVQAEQACIQAEQDRIQIEHERVQAEAAAVRNRQQELASIQHRRTRSGLHEGVHINPTNLFQTPTGPAAGAGGSALGAPPPPPGGNRGVRTGAGANVSPPPPEGGVGGMGPRPQRFPTPAGH